MRTILRFSAAVVFVTGVFHTNVSRAQILAYEQFDYLAGTTLNGQNGGYGFGGAWDANSTAANNALIYSGSFSYTDQYANTISGFGNRARVTGNGTVTGDNTGGTTANAQPRRGFTFARGTNSLGNQTTWLSFLAVRTGNGFTYLDTGTGQNLYYGRAAALQLHLGNNSERLTIGRVSQNGETNVLAPNDTWSMANRGSGSYVDASNVSLTNLPPLSTANFILIRIDHVGDDNVLLSPDTAYMWVNPANLGVEPSLASANAVSFAGIYERDYAFSWLRLFGGSDNATVGYGSMEFDEFKVGTTYWDVTLSPVPEPSALALVGLGALAVFCRRQLS